MKISAINPYIYVSQGQKQNKTSATNKNLISIPISNIYLGRDLVSFRNTSLNKNYFQLPSNCIPDEFQIEAGKAISNNESVIVEAPTGTGKTAIANYCISKNLKEGKKTFYTTPLKALSNQKYNEFKEIYGEKNVGILTGDRKENEKAPVVIMTTEVYRNMLLQNEYNRKNPLLNNLGSVIFDEFHYMGNIERGANWEEAVIYTPKNVQTLALSATIGNSQDLSRWLSKISDKNVHLISIPESKRHVPLIFDRIETRAYKKSEDWIQKQLKNTGTINYDTMEKSTKKPDLSDYRLLINHLNQKEQLPAIIFVFSKKFSRELLNYCANENKDLTSDNEKSQILDILEKHKRKQYIGRDLNEDALLKGYAIHNAGIIPAQKELIEELFQKKLIKAVIATETLSAGINMPAKTTVISSPYKPSEETEGEEKERLLTVNEFKQMAGRAGRRGIDNEGYVYTMPVDRNSEMDFLEFESCDTNPVESRYNPDYAFLCGYYEFNGEPRNLKNIFEKTFFAYSDEENVSENKVQTLIQDSLIRTNLLHEKGFISEDNGHYSLSDKGLMASKVKGYNTIPLINLIHSGVLKDITPQTLALTIGAIANETNNDEFEISNTTDYSQLTSNSEKQINNIEKMLLDSLSLQFKMLGKSIKSFDNYDEMLNYIENQAVNNSNPEILQDKLKDLKGKSLQIDIIQKTDCEMSPKEVLQNLIQGKTLPTKVLADNLEVLENYKKQIKTEDLADYIKKCEDELKEIPTNVKGKKAKTRLESRQKEISREIQNAKIMQQLEQYIYNAISSNHRYIKKNPAETVKKELKRTQAEFVKLTLKDEMKDEIKGLISIGEYKNKNNISNNERNNTLQGSECLSFMIRDTKELEEEEKNLDLPVQSVKYSKQGAQAAYRWALMNEINPHTMTNWEELNRIMPLCDEGSIYRSIMQTADLLSQINEIAQSAMDNSKSQNEFEYYKHLKETSQKSRELMLQKPLVI